MSIQRVQMLRKMMAQKRQKVKSSLQVMVKEKKKEKRKVKKRVVHMKTKKTKM